MKFQAYKAVFGDNEIDIPEEDFILLPAVVLEVFHERVRTHEQRLMRLVDQFAVAIYNTHIQGSISAMLQADFKSAEMLVQQAEPEEIVRKAWNYAKRIAESEYTVINEIIKDMKELILLEKELKKDKEKKNVVN